MATRGGFTLLEVLLAIAIVSILAAVTAVNYVESVKRSRDSRRIADLAQIRGSLELYRSNTGAYPTPGGASGMAFGVGSLTDSLGNTYMSKIPQDLRPGQTYYYTASGGDYTIGAELEIQPQTVCGVAGLDCGTSTDIQACNYCVGPYGDK